MFPFQKERHLKAMTQGAESVVKTDIVYRMVKKYKNQ